MGGPEHVFLASMAAYVGLDPRTEIRWVTHPFEESTRLLVEGRVDAVLAFPPQAQELRARQVGQVVVNSLVDRPWSQYFCCMAYAHRDFVRTHPIAIKRILRAFVKANDVCSLEPERVARFLVDEGYTKNYAYALETMQDVGYNRWREYDAEDTIRFYALRLQEARWPLDRAASQREGLFVSDLLDSFSLPCLPSHGKGGYYHRRLGGETFVRTTRV